MARFSVASCASIAALGVLSACNGGSQSPASSFQPTSAQDTSASRMTTSSSREPLITSTGPHGAGYTITVFARGTDANLSKPDPVVAAGGWTYVIYQNATTPTGGNGVSTLVRYGTGGRITRRIDIPGHSDGMRLNPYSHEMWITVNEDGNAALYTLNIDTFALRRYAFSAAPHGGGYDDVAFANGQAFVAA